MCSCYFYFENLICRKAAVDGYFISPRYNETTARELERTYHVSSKQYVGSELQIRWISELPPEIVCSPCEATLEDAYIYIANKK